MSITEIISTAFLMGLIGSLHCVGMCGPLALALPIQHRTNAGRLTGGIIYNTGRIFTYMLLGGILGSAGQYLLSPKIQSLFSIALGLFLFIYLLVPKKIKATSAIASWANKPFIKLRLAFGNLFQSKKYSSLFGIGLLNGLLPCGMIYLAISTSFLTGSVLKGSLFMLYFGMGTFPAMLASVFFGSYLNQKLRFKLRKAVPVFIFLAAALLVLRGLNFSIPFLSTASSTQVVSCH